jgi:hypothetical protein
VRTRLTVRRLEDRSVPADFTAATVGELNAAITAANQTPEADTITLAAGSTFTLTAVHNTPFGPTGLQLVGPTADLTIVGRGATIERSSAPATPAFRLFNVVRGGSLTLRDLTLQGGLAYGRDAEAEGGAVRSEGRLTLDHVTARDNVAQGSPAFVVPGYGITSGWTAKGGAVCARGDLTLTACTVTNNRAVGGLGYQREKNGRLFWETPGGAAFGGGVFVEDGVAAVTDSAVTANTARGGECDRKATFGGEAFGGGVFIGNQVSATLRGLTVTGNTAQGGHPKARVGDAGQGVGGGLYIGDSAVVLDAVTLARLTGNQASTSNDDLYSYGPYTLVP